MKKSRKVALIVLSILSFVFLGTFIALFFTFGTSYSNQQAGADISQGMLGIVRDLFVYPFNKGQATYLTGGILPFLKPYSAQTALILSIAGLILAGIVFILLALGIVFVCIKKKPIMIIFTPVMLMAGFVGMAIIGNGKLYLNLIERAAIEQKATDQLIVLIMLITAGLGFILTVVTYILGLVFARKNSVEEQPEIESVAEESADPEIVEEGEELNFASPEVEASSLAEPEPVPEEIADPEAEPAPVEEEPSVEPEPSHVEVNVNNGSAQGLDQNSLASLLREVVRDIVRDEIARNNANQPQQAQQAPAGNQSITGATFGGPLVVQYFNGGINGVTPAQPAPAPAPAQEPAPVKEEKKPEPEKKEEPKVEEAKPAPAPAPVVEAKPAAPLFVKKEQPADAPETPKYERLTFAERLLKSEKDIHDLYNELKNEILSWGVKSRISANGDTFRLHKKMYVRITVAGKSLKLYFALNPADYANSTLPIQDASNKDMYAEIPLVFKVKSGLSVRRCKELIQDCMEKDGFEQGEIGKVNWIKELKAELASGKKNDKADED